MDFPDGTLVRLRSRARGTFLYADDFGVGVSLSPRSASPGSAWEMRGGVAFVILRAASSGRYLALSPQNQQGPRIVQRGCQAPAHPSVMWMALDVWAAAGGGRRFVLLRHVFGLALRADGRRSGVTADDLHVPCWMMHWAVEVSPLRAAPPALLLPAPGTAPDRRRTVKIHVPILTPERVSGVILPIVDGRNTIVGSILGSTAMGLVEVAQGRGQELLVRTGLLQEQLGRGHLPQGLAALAFVPSRSWGHATRTLRSLPLNIALEDDEDEDGGREDAAAGNVRGNAADVDHGANDEERPGGEGHDAHADMDDGANDQERPGGEGHDAHADVDDGANDQERPGGEGHDAHADVDQGGAAVDVPLDAGELEAGAAAQGVVDAAGGVAEDMLGYLQEVYQIMHKKFDKVQMLVAEKRAIDEAAAARGDWTGVPQLHRSRQKAIDNAIIEFDDMSEKAARLRNWLVSHSVAAPSPPRGARVHPNSLLPRRRRG